MLVDPRLETLASLLINHSTRLQAGDHVLIESFDIPREMIIALVRAARAVGGHPHVATRDSRIMRELTASSDKDGLTLWADCDTYRMSQMDAYIGLRGSANASELAGIADSQQKLYSRTYAAPVHFDRRVNHTRWCVLRWPSPSMAQLAGLDTETFEDFYFRVCTLDYGAMATAAAALVQRMTATNRVRICGPGDTDLHFSIAGIPVIPCCGEYNIPDGECFTAPIRNSVNGCIAYNTPSIYHGESFENVRLEFVDGRITAAHADRGTDKLEKILNTDEGARYIGEFAIGFNPHIREPMKDILFDEKIAGSLHFTPGRAYEEADNGNRSDVHWDLVLIQRPEYGGGEIYFDDELIRRDGLFVPTDLTGLNPDKIA